MNWQDKGYLISLNKYSENSSIAQFLTENHGKITGIIFGSSSKKIKNYLIIGNKIHLNYTSKNENNIGNFKVEIDKFLTPIYFDDRFKLSCIIYSMDIVKNLTVDGQFNKKIYYHIDNLFTLISEENWLKNFILWELTLFKILGYEINFQTYVDKELINDEVVYKLKGDNKKKIPNFLIDKNEIKISNNDMVSAFKISGDFLEKSILNAENLEIVNSRNNLMLLFNKL